LQGVGEPPEPKAEPQPQAQPSREENAPQKAMPQDETARNSDEKPGFWGRLFGGKKEE